MTEQTITIVVHNIIVIDALSENLYSISFLRLSAARAPLITVVSNKNIINNILERSSN